MQKKRLIRALQAPVEFRRLIKNIFDLNNAAILFSQHTGSLINVLLKNPEEFKRLIKNVHDLNNMAIWFPQYAGSLINVILKNPEEFRRLIKNAHDLNNMAIWFPQHTEIFQWSSVEQANEARKIYIATKRSEANIRKHTRILAQASRPTGGASFFKLLPDELLVKIAGLTGNPETHNEKTSEAIAYDNFDKPM